MTFSGFEVGDWVICKFGCNDKDCQKAFQVKTVRPAMNDVRPATPKEIAEAQKAAEPEPLFKIDKDATASEPIVWQATAAPIAWCDGQHAEDRDLEDSRDDWAPTAAPLVEIRNEVGPSGRTVTVMKGDEVVFEHTVPDVPPLLWDRITGEGPFIDVHAPGDDENEDKYRATGHRYYYAGHRTASSELTQGIVRLTTEPPTPAPAVDVEGYKRDVEHWRARAMENMADAVRAHRKARWLTAAVITYGALIGASLGVATVFKLETVRLEQQIQKLSLGEDM